MLRMLEKQMAGVVVGVVVVNPWQYLYNVWVDSVAPQHCLGLSDMLLLKGLTLRLD